jgi:NADH-quinone oxidoreductase subunit J
MMIFVYLLLVLISALSVILSKNIIQSVIYLIIVFFLCSLLFIYLGADFIGLIILIVYIGAIAVLFLFVIMMLNIRILEISSTFSIYLPLAIFLSFIFIILFLCIYSNSLNFIEFSNLSVYVKWPNFNNIKIIAIGQLLFNECYILFVGATLLLFIAMIGAITLTLEKKVNVKFKYSLQSKNLNWSFLKSWNEF